MKRILLKATKSNLLNFEELTTLVVQIESILNSRPLSPMSSDPNDLQPLTPGHFIVGAPIMSFPEHHTAPDSFSLSSRWSLIQGLKDSVWNRWSHEYLSQLQTRSKWTCQQENLKVDQLVLLKDPSKTAMQWNLARIVKTYPGEDNLVRVVDVKTARGTFRRAISNILPLPDDVGLTSNGGRDVPVK
ncbi:uncharacterized protein [Parasteatoda tepidariorum]|uniref:uncharacterized protein n=1 Tax=Parasteatoda tepidariorum TaxID=114398 RepID=UPI0039BD6CEC